MLTLEHTGTGELFYATHQSAGFDLTAHENLTLNPNCRAAIGTGLRITDAQTYEVNTIQNQRLTLIPELQIRPRSGLAIKQGITVLNTPSTIDADYRGEIKVILINHSTVPFEIKQGDRIAQAICALIYQLPQILVKENIRGEGGFGSTGK